MSSKSKIKDKKSKILTNIKKIFRGYPHIFKNQKNFPTLAIWVSNESLRAQKQKSIRKIENFQQKFKKFSGVTPYFQKSKNFPNNINMGVKRKRMGSKTKINKKKLQWWRIYCEHYFRRLDVPQA
jgi:hypothetical protein